MWSSLGEMMTSCWSLARLTTDRSLGILGGPDCRGTTTPSGVDGRSRRPRDSLHPRQAAPSLCMDSCLDRFQQQLTAIRAPRTVLTYRRVAETFLTFLEGNANAQPTQNDVEQFLARPTATGFRRSIASRNQELAGVRALATFLRKSGTWTLDPTEEIPFLKESRRDPAFLTTGELARLFEVTAREPEEPLRARNLAILALFSQLGLRVHELVRLDFDQADLVSNTLLGVWGKGGTRVDLPLNAKTADILNRWMTARGELVDDAEAALFVNMSGHSRTRLSIRSTQRLIARLWSKCASPKRISCHSLRHTTATLAITLGVDVSGVGDLLRHTSLDVTRRYIHLVGARRREAVDRLAVTIPSSVITAVPTESHRKPVQGILPNAMAAANDTSISIPEMVDAQDGLSG